MFIEIFIFDLILVIEVEDVKEVLDMGSLFFGFLGCCDDISIIRWMVFVFIVVVLFVLIVSCLILLIWCVEFFLICVFEILNFIMKNI